MIYVHERRKDMTEKDNLQNEILTVLMANLWHYNNGNELIIYNFDPSNKCHAVAYQMTQNISGLKNMKIKIFTNPIKYLKIRKQYPNMKLKLFPSPSMANIKSILAFMETAVTKVSVKEVLEDFYDNVMMEGK